MTNPEPQRDEEVAAAALYEVSSAILSTLDVEAVLQRVCDNAAHLLGASGACITEYRPDEAAFFLKTCSGTFCPALNHTFPYERSLSARALKEGAPVIDNDFPNGPAASVAESLPVPIDRALISLLNGRDGVLGTLVCIADYDRDPFTEADAELLSAFATQAALAVENASLYQKQKTRAQELERLRSEREEQIQRLHDLHAAGLAVTSDLDLEALLDRVADEARKLTHAEYGALGVLDEDGESLERFITSGMAEERPELLLPLVHDLMLLVRDDENLSEGLSRVLRTGPGPGAHVC